MTIHIGAEKHQIAETVLMPGDPYRAKWAAETFLDGAECVNETRGMLGFTGHWNGHRVTIQGSGMGMPSMSIYAHELVRDYGAKTLIRVGSCGAMQDNIGIRDIVLGMAASTIGAPFRAAMREVNYAPCPDYHLLRAAADAVEKRKLPLHVGGIYSSEAFYDERDDLMAQLIRQGTLAVEMEAAELYAVAARHGCRALAILTVSDHIVTHEALPSDQRERSFGDMIEIALEAAFA